MQAVNNPSVIKLKEGKSITEYKENEIDDIALQTALRQSYRMFKLFNGTFEYIRDSFGEEKLKNDLSSFFSQYIASLNVDQIDLFNTLDGILFIFLLFTNYFIGI